MKTYIHSIVYLAAGIGFLIRNIIYIRDEDKLQNYLRKSYKGRLWVKKLGMVRTLYLCKKIFLPLGSIVSLGLIAAGLFLLF